MELCDYRSQRCGVNLRYTFIILLDSRKGIFIFKIYIDKGGICVSAHIIRYYCATTGDCANGIIIATSNNQTSRYNHLHNVIDHSYLILNNN